MQFIMFTKHLEGLDLSGIIEALKSVGVSGADLAVRPGYPVHPGNVEKELPAAASRFADEGLAIPLVTTPGDFTTPDIEYADRLYAACGESGVRHIKLGYWNWKAGDKYWEMLDQCRGNLDGFQELSAKHGVQTMVHNHSGTCMGLNASSSMHLLKGFDPQHVGSFADAGHLSICGEPIAMALNIVAEYLSAIAFKDLFREPRKQNGRTTWQTGMARISRGFVDWPLTLKTLKSMNFTGPISMHSEYGGEPVESVIDLTRIDMRYIRRVLEDVSSE